ncbi:helix-turn-helix domain-containing protein [Paenibacillus illinoisensis]|uniref:Helix-turn-helix domain protein n=1 Tax=Paenibacillus illinoisensis TaxID=59845 RepID=A0A2W0C730_9BACL|nr:Helix-turn-helix domain protein [Paenibacillus illinoisensis]
MLKFEIKLDSIIERKNISRRELAKRTGIRRATINDLCNNKAKHISLENLALICDELDIIDVSELLVIITE